MDTINLTSINKVVYQRFPELSGVRPKIQKQENNTLLTYQNTLQIAEERFFVRSVRVVVNSHGEIVKISTSR